MLSSCTQSPQSDDNVACTMDAKVCPDGSYVGRVAPDCSFARCPGPTQEPTGCDKEYRECPDGLFVQRVLPDCDFEACLTGQNSEAIVCDYSDPSRKFVLKDADSCSRARFACEPGQEAFIDDCGCGCILKTSTNPEYSEYSEEKLCRYEDRQGNICPAVYLPVCGIRGDGSLKTYQSSCEACQDPRVDSYTDGNCLPNTREDSDGFYS